MRGRFSSRSASGAAFRIGRVETTDDQLMLTHTHRQERASRPKEEKMISADKWAEIRLIADEWPLQWTEDYNGGRCFSLDFLHRNYL
ncbi:hypothetical protein GWI33_005601 [Rhynchophorus ferrugineus]|uniref:Uncharacterized protein n=1 Tax=Rhynchophorus ferrugineus TaxID=354439 RepID=A0A834IVN7_RHYFE|nr:hypothetical protein GWI33_005601 [Rhynchophorus ferrugineus]